MKPKPVAGGTDGEDVHYQVMSRSKLGVCVSIYNSYISNLEEFYTESETAMLFFVYVFFLKQSIVCGYLSMEIPVRMESKTDT